MGCVNVIRATPTKDVTVSVQVMASALKDNVVGVTLFPAMPTVDPIANCLDALVTTETVTEKASVILRWLPPVLHFLEPLNFTKGFLAHHDGLMPVLARWCYNSF